MDEDIKELISRYVRIDGEGENLTLTLQEGQTGGRLIFMDAIKYPGPIFEEEMAEYYAERLRDIFYEFSYDLLDITDDYV